MNQQVIDVTVVEQSVAAVLPNQEAFFNKVQEIDSSIANEQEQLKQDLESLDNAEPDIEVTRHWYGTVDIDSICESLTNVYDDLRGYIQTCGRAIRTANANLTHTLRLIELLAKIEKDLYEQLDNESLQGNVLKGIIKDWCAKNNIRDEEVAQLLETSFQRAYTLRDRINNVKGELLKRLNHCDSELQRLSSEVDSLNLKSATDFKYLSIHN